MKLSELQPKVLNAYGEKQIFSLEAAGAPEKILVIKFE